MIKSKIKKIQEKLLLNKNKLLNRTFIPNRYEHLYIEVSNICNLKCKFCAYTKGNLPKKIMKDDLFKSIINKAIDYGYIKFGLTPMTGDVFVDKNFIGKLEFLENKDKVLEYSFFTNLTLVKTEILDSLLSYKKLNYLSVSVYGHDEESFKKVTLSNKKTYEVLVQNLEYLYQNIEKINFNLEIGIRTIGVFSLNSCQSSLCLIIKKFKEKNIPINITTHYNNWGGMILQEDVNDLGIRLAKEDDVYKLGACSLLFYKNLVLSDGRLNACACRDVNATMIIGNLKTQSFNEIFSTRNEKYMKLIRNQNHGDFKDVCKSCDMYRSIYKNHSIYRYHKFSPTTLEKTFEFFKNV